MNGRRMVAWLIALVMTVAAASCSNAQQDSRGQQQSVDYTTAARAEVRNAEGQVVLSGQFVTDDDYDSDEIDRKARLSVTGVDADAFGEIEVEVRPSGKNPRQEVEFSVANVQPGGVFTFVVDGREVATLTANDRGRAELERDVSLPGGSAPR